ncbi:MAG: hypothetical protein ABFS56_07945 [Pseudomonadota bacterium]
MDYLPDTNIISAMLKLDDKVLNKTKLVSLAEKKSLSAQSVIMKPNADLSPIKPPQKWNALSGSLKNTK